MKVAIMQPYFFPYIGYWQLISAVDVFVLFDDVNYIKRGWIDRNRIIYQNKERYINVYLKGASQNRLINEISINRESSENINNLRIIKDAYKKAPMFNEVYPLLENIIAQDESNLAIYLGTQIKAVCDYLDISTEIIYSSDIKKDNDKRGQDKIIEICKELGADTYINAIGGRKLYEHDVFESQNIKLRFLDPKTKELTYEQFNSSFIPSLSIIDVLMFNSKSNIHNMLKGYNLNE